MEQMLSPKPLPDWLEAEKVQRAVVEWVNTCPEAFGSVTYEALPDDAAGMCVTTVQPPYKARRYISGGYLGSYQFGIIYRVQPSDSDDQLNAVEVLNRIAAWTEQNPKKPNLTEKARVRSIRRDNGASLLAAYEDGTKDYQITITMQWEVI